MTALPTDPIALQKLAAGAKSAPVRLGDAAPFRISTKPMDSDWKKRFDAMYPTVDVLPAALEGKVPAVARRHLAERRQALMDGLLKFGGERVCLPAWEGDLDAILDRGQLFAPKPAVLKRGEASQCHENSALIWSRKPDKMLLATGYYLTDDGMWRQHSWCIEIRAPRAPRLVETTNLAVAYFGFVMTAEEAAKFAEHLIF